MKVTITHVYPVRGVAASWVETGDGTAHRVGHTPWDGWSCDCPRRGRKCAHLDAVKELLPVAAIELGGVNVKAGVVPAPACVTGQEAADAKG